MNSKVEEWRPFTVGSSEQTSQLVMDNILSQSVSIYAIFVHFVLNKTWANEYSIYVEIPWNQFADSSNLERFQRLCEGFKLILVMHCLDGHATTICLTILPTFSMRIRFMYYCTIHHSFMEWHRLLSVCFCLLFIYVNQLHNQSAQYVCQLIVQMMRFNYFWNLLMCKNLSFLELMHKLFLLHESLWHGIFLVFCSLI